MKQVYFLMTLFIFFALNINAQNMMTNGDLEQWDDASTPTGYNTAQNISQETTNVHGGTYSAAQTEDGAKVLKQVITGITEGDDYTISFWYYDNTPNAKVKLASAWLDASGSTVAGNEAELIVPFNPDDDQWHQYSAVVTAPTGAAKMKFVVKVIAQGTNGGGTVYYDDLYFGSVVSLPEPTNHVTNLVDSIQVLNNEIIWDLPTEGQLPNGFLIIGEKAGYTADVPVDGTPVADDLDWSDGVVAKNIVADGTKFDFSDLEGNTSYTYTVYPFTNAGAYIDYKTDGAPTATGVTASATMISFEGFESGTSGNWTSFNISGTEDWIFPDFKGRHTAKINGNSSANENWLVSPALDLSAYDNAHFAFTNTQISDDGIGNPLELYVSTNFDGSDIATATWTPLTSVVGFNEDIDLADYVGNSSVYLAFKYTSEDGVASSVYKIDNLQVYTTVRTILVTSITVQGAGGVSTIDTDGGTLQMEATVLPDDATNKTVTWSVADGTGSATIDANGLLTAVADGTVTVTATANDGSGVSGSTDITISNQTSGINDINNNIVSVYPNPANDFFTVKSTMNGKISLIDVSGKIIFTNTVKTGINNFSLSGLGKGLYFINITFENGIIKNTKLSVK